MHYLLWLHGIDNLLKYQIMQKFISYRGTENPASTEQNLLAMEELSLCKEPVDFKLIASTTILMQNLASCYVLMQTK